MTKSEIVNWEFPLPFASAEDATTYKMGTEASEITFSRGFSQVYSSEAGQKVALGDVNGMFNKALGGALFDQKGGWRTFSKEVSDAIGGYPEGAILYWYDQDSGKIRTVRSMKPDNTDDFVENPELIDDSSWAFVDDVPVSSFLVRLFAGKNGGTGFVSTPMSGLVTHATWTAPFDCVILGSIGTISTGTDDAGSFLQVKNMEDEGFGTAGIIRYSIPAALAQTAMYDYSEDLTIAAPEIKPPSGGGAIARIVAYVARGGQVQVLGGGSMTFSYFPLTF